MPDESFSLRQFVRERALWLLIFCVLAFFYRPLFGETFFFRDLYLLFYGKKILLAEALRSGQIPLWDPLMHGGQPFLASPGNSAFYPFNILFVLLPGLVALNVHLVLQFVCCAVSAYFLGRALRLSPAASFVCGAAYTFCGYVLSSATLLVLIQAVPWAPALLASVHLLMREQRKRWLVAAAIFGALPLLGGGAEMSAMAFALAAAWAVLGPRASGLGPRLWLAALAIVFAIGLSLIQTLPAYEVIRNSSRGEKRDYATFVQWSVAPQRLPELVVPRFFGPTDHLRRTDYWGGPFEIGYPYIVSIYFGAAVLMLATAGLFSDALPLRARVVLGVFAAAGFVLALGIYLPFFHFLYEHVPLIGIFRFPVKALQMTLVPVAVLAAAGVSAARKLLVPAIAVAVLMFACAAAHASVARMFFGTELPAAFAHSFLHAGITTALFAAAVMTRREFAIAAVVAIDLAVSGWRVNPYASRELFVEPPLVAKVRAIIGDGHLYRTPDPFVQRLNVPSNENVWLAWWEYQQLSRYTAATFGIPLIFHEDYDGLAPIQMSRMTDAMPKMAWPQRLRVLSDAGATAIITPDVISDPAVDLVDTMRGADGRPLYLYRNRGARPLRFSAPAAVKTIKRSFNEWSAEVEASQPGELVFAESWYPGWRMTVDGREVPQLRAGFGLPAAAVPAGRHVVTKTYRPRLPLIGAVLSLATALMLAFWRVNR